MIKIFWIGKTKNKDVGNLLDYYLKLSSKFQPVKVCDLPKVRKNLPKDEIKKLEGETILAKFEPDAVNILLDENGEQQTSVQFSKFLQTNSNRNINFFIGGAFGFSENIKQKADLLLSFSNFTFTHDMIRALLCEQIYRAFTISAGKEYHY